MNPWKGFLSILTVIGAAFVAATAYAGGSTPLPAILTPLPMIVNPTTHVVTIGVRVTRVDPNSLEGVPSGFVLFFESNNQLGNGVFDGADTCTTRTQSCDFHVSLPGYAPGPHTIEARWSGDTQNEPTFLTFTVYVPGPSWLPAVLSLLE